VKLHYFLSLPPDFLTTGRKFSCEGMELPRIGDKLLLTFIKDLGLVCKRNCIEPIKSPLSYCYMYAIYLYECGT